MTRGVRRVLVSVVLAASALIPLAVAGSARASGCDSGVPVASLWIDNTPLAPAASLAAGQSVPFGVVARDAAGNCVAGATVYVYFSGQGTAIAAAASNCYNNGVLTPNYASCTTNQYGNVQGTYTTPTPLPATGQDLIRATVDPLNPAVVPSAQSTYSYALLCDTGAAVTSLSIKSTPLASAGSLASGGSAPFDVLAKDSTGNCVSAATVYLNFSGPGTAVASTAAKCGTGSTLPSTYVACTTDQYGVVHGVFGTPSPLPNGGQAVLGATADPVNASAATAASSYTYGSLSVAVSSVRAVEGQQFSGVVGTLSVQNVPNPTSLAVSITWGDGTSSSGAVVATPSALYNITGTHTYAEEQVAGTNGYPLSVTVGSSSGPSTTGQGVASVSDAPLTASGTNFTARVRKQFSGVVASFSDGDPLGTVPDYTASISWGDGTSSAGTISAVSNGFTVAGSHTYRSKGSFAVTTRISDVGGATASASAVGSVLNK
jgi:hypothetical protein